jgi:adenylate cyclase
VPPTSRPGCSIRSAGSSQIRINSLAKPFVRSDPNVPQPYRWLAAALGQLGRTAEAKEALEKAIEIAPASFDMYVRKRVPWHRPEDHAHMLDGLRKAGWEG